MTHPLGGSLVQNVLRLCRKVEEVVYNNDWPTEEGQQDEGGECHILNLVIAIRREFE